MSVLTEWYGRKRLPASKTVWRMGSMAAGPIAVGEIARMCSPPGRGGVEGVEGEGPAAALRVPDLPGEDGRLRRLGPAELLEVQVSEVVDEDVAERVRGAGEGDGPPG